MFSRRPRHEVVVYTRQGCHLCDDAFRLLERWKSRHRLAIRAVDIDGDAALVEAFGMQVPVVFIDGKKRFVGTVDPVLLRRLLEHGSPIDGA